MSIYGEDYGVTVPPTYNIGDESVFNPSSTPSWEEEYAKLIGISPNNDLTFSNANSPSNADILSAINYDPGIFSGLSDTVKKLFTKKDGSLDLLKLGALGGGLAGLLGGNKSSSAPSGYQGSIPKYTATRNMVTAPTAGRRPGAGGTRYGGDVTFTPRGSSAAAPVGGLASLVGNTTSTDPAAQQLMDDMRAVNTAPVLRAVDAPEAAMRMVDPSQYAVSYAKGGSTGRYLQGGTDGMADEIPAQIGRDQPAALSHGEFVIPADVVSHLGNGNSDAGAKKLYSMMDKIREARTGTKEQGKEINPDKFMPGGLAQAYAAGGEVQRFQTGGVSGLGTAANAGVTGTESNLSNWAGEYVTDMLGKGKALSEMPYQEYGGPLTAGASNLQNKVFSGLSNVNFPSNLGQSFSSTGAYQPPQLNMAAYQPSPIGAVSPPNMMLNQGSNGFGDFGPIQGAPQISEPAPAYSKGFDDLFGRNMQAMTGLQNQGPAQPGGTYEDYLESVSMFHALPQTREQFEANKNFTQKTRDQGIGILGRGNMGEIMSGLGGAPGQMPQGGLSGLAGMMPQQPQQPQGVAQQYMNPYLQSVLDPQIAELRRQNEITNMGANAKLTSAGAFGGGRQAIVNAENNRNLMQEMNKTVGQGYSNAYDKAMQQFNTEQGQGMGLANLMAGQGGIERGIESEGIAADKAAFEEARANPYKMVQYQQSLLSGLPLAAQNINTAQPSTFANVLTGAGSVASLLNNLGLGTAPATPAPKI